MQKAGIEPTEHISTGKFWSAAKKVIQIEIDNSEAMPCECSL